MPKMNLALYANTENGTGEQLQRVLESTVPEAQVESCMTLECLDSKLKQPANRVSIAVLLAASRQELSELYAIKDLFRDIRIILILPDSKSETITLGHKLAPRFISYNNGNYNDVGAVLRKMVAYMKSNYPEYSVEN
jgi:hypothetical protein